MVVIISADEIKKTMFGYLPKKAELFHTASAKQADKLFYEELKKHKFNNIIFLNGGAASGKTEFLSSQLSRKKSIVFDATLSTEEGARIKLNEVFKLKKKPIIYAIIPDDLKRAFIAFLSRDRKFKDSHFYKTHSGARKTLLWITLKYPQIAINIVESSYTENQTMQFAKIEFGNRTEFIAYLNKIQMSENDIISFVQSKF
ncbi:hypothetical protein HYW46_02485 [Candidatus Daviesbacteria bacterium]|nr:hypothetical protein [Candidatus Daviesbacteria bacterium]